MQNLKIAYLRTTLPPSCRPPPKFQENLQIFLSWQGNNLILLNWQGNIHTLLKVITSCWPVGKYSQNQGNLQQGYIPWFERISLLRKYSLGIYSLNLICIMIDDLVSLTRCLCAPIFSLECNIISHHAIPYYTIQYICGEHTIEFPYVQFCLH